MINKNLFLEKPKIRLNKAQKKEIQRVKKLIELSELKFEKSICQVCKKDEYEIISKYDRYGLPYEACLCKNCGLIYSNPRFDYKTTKIFYENHYRKIYTGIHKKNQLNKFFNDQILKGEEIIKFIEKNKSLDNISSVLEVGCGMGGILHPFKLRGKHVLGIDFGSEYLDFGIKNGLNLMKGDIKGFKTKKYDLIIYSHVLEHVIDLDQELKHVKENLNEKGILYVEVPGIYSLEKYYKCDLSKYLQNVHTFNFCLKSLTNVLNKNGFELVAGTEEVKSIFTYTQTITKYKSCYIETKSMLNKFERQRIYFNYTHKGIKRNIILFLRKVGLIKILLKVKNIFR